MKTVPLGDGRVALVDDADFEALKHFNWRVDQDGYVRRQFRQDGKKKIAYLHREIMGSPAGKQIHHKNENKLDCQRDNLEAVDELRHREIHASRLVSWCRRNRWSRRRTACPICKREFPSERGSNYHTCSTECARKAMVASGQRTAHRSRVPVQLELEVFS